MSGEIRAFIAIRLPQSILSPINEVQEDLKRYGFPVRWVQPQNMHLTLKFFGNVKESETEGIGFAMKECAGRSPAIRLFAKGIGVFPSLAGPRVIWAGLSGSVPLLLSLRDDLEKRLEESGYGKEERPFKGHLTIGRFKDRVKTEKLTEALRKHKDFTTGLFEAGEIILFKSDLLPQGPAYTELFKVNLAAS